MKFLCVFAVVVLFLNTGMYYLFLGVFGIFIAIGPSGHARTMYGGVRACTGLWLVLCF